MPCNRVNWLCVVLQAMYPAPRTAVCRKSNAKRPLSETAAVPVVFMKEDRDPRNAAMTAAVPPNMDCAAESSHCTTMVAMIGGVVVTVTEPCPEGSAPAGAARRVFQA